MQTPVFIGADVAKATITVSTDQTEAASQTLANEAHGIRHWLKQLPEGALIAMEATNTYHLALADLATAAGFTVYVLNPHDVAHYRKAVGARAKTDRCDARLLARYLAHEHRHLRPYRPLPAASRQLATLIKRRAKLVAARTSLRHSLAGVRSLKGDLNAVLSKLNVLIAKIEAQIQALINASASWRERQRQLQRIPGVGLRVSAGLLAAFEHGPFACADAFVAFIGYDLRARDSGQAHGKRRLSKRGDSEMRRLLYTSAMAVTGTRAWGPFYAAYLARGLSRTAALVALARRIARTAWSIVTHNTTFDPVRISQPLQ